MNEEWLEYLDQYFDRLERTIDALEDHLLTINECTRTGAHAKQQQAVDAMTETLRTLEKLQQERTGLLSSFASKDLRRLSLQEVLKRGGEYQRSERSKELAERIENVRTESLSLFVVQFQLFESTKAVLKAFMASQTDPGGYGQRTVYQGGGLLDEAA